MSGRKLIAEPRRGSAALTRGLLRRARQGALATLAADSGAPYCSLVNVATMQDGSPILLVSRLALHTKNLLGDRRVSLLVTEAAEGDPLEHARIMIGGEAEPVPEARAAAARRRYLWAHPAAEAFVDFEDFLFVQVAVAGVHLVAGFGRIVDLRPEQVLTDMSGADSLSGAESAIVDHMNADHRDTMALYATGLLGDAALDWRCSGCDAEGLDMQAGARVLRLEFPQRATTPDDVRRVLKQLAEQARPIASP